MNHVMIINRYDDEFSDYRNYIDHTQNYVSYISLKGKSGLIDHSLCAFVTEVDNLHTQIVLQESVRIHHQHPIDFVIAFSEYDLDAAALVRTELGINGAKNSDNQLVRNKADMKAALFNSRVRYPQYREVSSEKDVTTFCHEYGYPVILKPQVGAASEGVVKIERPEDIPSQMDFTGYEIEEYVEGSIYHIDAILAGSGMPYFKVSKYLNTCLDFRNGKPLGSVTVDDPVFINRAKDFTREVCSHLNLKNQAIHLEMIECNGELVFLEIGGRVGGGEIPFIVKRNEGVDLYALWTSAAVGAEVPTVTNQITGFLMMPNQFQGGCYFDRKMQLSHPLLTWHDIRCEHQSSGFSYDEIPARLHFRGETQLSVEEAIKECMVILSQAIRAV